MKKHWTKPGFEFVFALSLIAIMGIPPLVFAQSTKSTDIIINNRDTIINGKNIKELSPGERKQALKDIDNLNVPEVSGYKRMMLRRRSFSDTGADRMTFRRHFDSGGNMADMWKDSSKRVFKFRMRRPEGNDSTFTFNYRLKSDQGDRFEGREFGDYMHSRWFGNFRRRNVQQFEYTNTGSDGIITHISFRVNDASPDKIKAITGNEKAELELKDLNLVPEFSSGKTLLIFNLASKSPAEVKFTDSEGKTIWSDKALNGSFSKSFPLGLNGVYFLQVKQAGKVALKRVVKEE